MLTSWSLERRVWQVCGLEWSLLMKKKIEKKIPRFFLTSGKISERDELVVEKVFFVLFRVFLERGETCRR